MRVLVDTSALIALFVARDQYSGQARSIARKRPGNRTYVGTTAILTELHSHLLYIRDGEIARGAISSLLNDSLHSWVSVTDSLISGSISNWLIPFSDQGFSLTDALSFEVMRQQKLTHAFAFNTHFEIAGYQLLR